VENAAEVAEPANAEAEPVSWCPSGAMDRPESLVLGVRSQDDGSVAYLDEPVPASEVLGMVPEGIEPRRILRFASHCESSCANRVGTECGLINRISAVPAPPHAAAVPRCHLRPRCKWWQQTGVEACHRCPAVSTLMLADDHLGNLVADPATTQEQLDSWIASAEHTAQA
jgi:hypothetical protein